MTLNLFVEPLDHMLSDWVLLKGVEKKSPNLAFHVACTNCFYTSCDLSLYVVYRGERVLYQGMLLDAL